MKIKSIKEIMCKHDHPPNVVLLLLNKEGIIEQAQVSPPDLLPDSSDALIGKNWFETYMPELSGQSAFNEFQKLFNDKSHRLINAPGSILVADKKEKQFIWHSLPKIDSDQSMTAVWLSGIDYSNELLRKKELKLALDNLFKKSQFILDNSIEAIVTLTDKGVINTVNHSAETMFGYSENEIIDQKINILMPASQKEIHDNYLINYLQTDIKNLIGTGIEIVGLHKDGREFPIELSISEDIIDDEQILIVIIRDITKRKDTEKSLMQRNEELKEIQDKLVHMDRLNAMAEMVTGIAHELNQPLAAIATYSHINHELLLTTINNAKELSHSLKQIDDQAQRASKVITHLRSSLTKKRQPYVLININDLVKESIELANMDPRIKTVTIDTRFDNSIPSVRLDVIQIQQVLINLIHNSIDSIRNSSNISKNKYICIRTKLDENYIRISILDNGSGLIGIDKADIFNPFETTKDSGMGMGLAICRSIITTHGGVLDYNADNKDLTEFYFTLPLTSQIE